MIKPYCETDTAVVYLGDNLQVLWSLAGSGIIVDGVVSDPPYSSGGLHRSDRNQTPVEKYVSTGAKSVAYMPHFSGDNRDQRSYALWLTLVMAAAFRISRSNAPACIFTDWRQVAATVDGIQAGGWTYQGLQPWLKPKHAARPRKGWFWSSGEFVAVATAGAMDQPEEIGCLPGFVEAPSPPSAKRMHVNEKPAPVCDWLVSCIRPGGLVLDMCAGSGAIGVAAIRSGRRALLIEAEEVNAEIIAERLFPALGTRPRAPSPEPRAPSPEPRAPSPEPRAPLWGRRRRRWNQRLTSCVAVWNAQRPRRCGRPTREGAPTAHSTDLRKPFRSPTRIVGIGATA